MEQFPYHSGDELENLAKKLQDTLAEQNIPSTIISNAEEYDFEEGDCIF